MKHLLLLSSLLLAFLLPVQGWAAIALDAGHVEATEATLGFLTVPFTAPTGSVIVVSVGNTARTVTGIAYNGGTFQELFENDLSGIGSARIATYLSVTGADGAEHNMVITFSAAQAGELGHAIISAWTGVETSSIVAAHRTIYSDGTDGGDLDITVVDSSAGDAVLHGIFNFGTNLGAVATTVRLVNAISGGDNDHLLQYTIASGASTAMTRTGGEFGTAWAMALVPASGGGAAEIFGFKRRRVQ